MAGKFPDATTSKEKLMLDEHARSGQATRTIFDENNKPMRHPLKSMHSQMHQAAEELRLEGKGSEDPAYKDSHKNK